MNSARVDVADTHLRIYLRNAICELGFTLNKIRHHVRGKYV